MVRTEVRSLHGDSHLGHVFRWPKRSWWFTLLHQFCLTTICACDDMESEGYGAYLTSEDIT